MELKYVWNTNTIIYFLQTHIPPSVKLLLDRVIDDSKPAISSITEIELQSWQSATDDDLLIIKNFIGDCNIIELERDVKLQTIAIRKQSRLKLPDAIIAATAIVYNLTLITRNVADFGRVPDLNILNPYEGNNPR